MGRIRTIRKINRFTDVEVEAIRREVMKTVVVMWVIYRIR